ncbi:MAG: hypothetical protein ACOCQ4_02250 [bacterium]
MEYKVLWIDDEFKTQKDFIGYAEQEDINITAFESHEEGIQHLEKDLDAFHAVILDAKVLQNQNDTRPGLNGLTASRDKLIQLNEKVYLPWFIFTGQPDYTDSRDFREIFGDFYIKGTDNEILLNDLKEAIEQKEEFILQKKYEAVFEVCTPEYHLEDIRSRVMETLKSLEVSPAAKNTRDLFNPLRKIIEQLFAAFNKFELLPDEVHKGNGSINKSCNFLSGKNDDYELHAEILPPVITRTLWNSLQIIQDASHADEKLHLKVDEHVQKLNTDFLHKSVVYQLLDVLVWFKKFIDSNPQRNNWTALKLPPDDEEVYKGMIRQDTLGNYYCGEFALNYQYTQENFTVGSEIQILEYQENTNPHTNLYYPYYAKKFVSIN